MGGLIGKQSPPPLPPAPALPELEDPEVKEQENRIEALERRRRGRAGTIETGFRGVLTPPGQSQNPGKAGKTFLGE